MFLALLFLKDDRLECQWSGWGLVFTRRASIRTTTRMIKSVLSNIFKGVIHFIYSPPEAHNTNQLF
jgi:hypothetical protein